MSPFEYYAIDNWQELEKIGRIFEDQLKSAYHEIDEKTRKLGGQAFPEQYERKKFKWEVGEIDKNVHVLRYTPVYTET